MSCPLGFTGENPHVKKSSVEVAAEAAADPVKVLRVAPPAWALKLRKLTVWIRYNTIVAILIYCSLLVNIWQVLCLPVKLISLSLYRKVERPAPWVLSGILIFVLEYLSGIRLVFSGDRGVLDFFRHPAKNAKRHNVFFFANHIAYVDWMGFFCLGHRLGYHCLSNMRIMMKNVLKYLPGPGWASLLHEYIFLKRVWTEDQTYLQRFCQNWQNDADNQCHIAMFPEGTFIDVDCLEKVQLSHDFAQERKLNKVQYVITPRWKGMITCLQNLQKSCGLVVDCTFAFQGVQKPETNMQAESDNDFDHAESNSIFPTVESDEIDEVALQKAYDDPDGTSNIQHDETSSSSSSSSSSSTTTTATRRAPPLPPRTHPLQTTASTSAFSPDPRRPFQTALPLLSPARRLPDFLDFFGGEQLPATLHIHLESFSMDQVPSHDTHKLKQWLYDRYALKDKRLQAFHQTGHFAIEQEQNNKQKKKDTSGDSEEYVLPVSTASFFLFPFLMWAWALTLTLTLAYTAPVLCKTMWLTMTAVVFVAIFVQNLVK